MSDDLELKPEGEVTPDADAVVDESTQEAPVDAVEVVEAEAEDQGAETEDQPKEESLPD